MILKLVFYYGSFFLNIPELHSAFNLVKNHNNCLVDIYCEQSPIKNYKETINNMKDKDTSIIIGGRGWPHSFSGSKPRHAMNNWWMYYVDRPFTTYNLLEHHEKLLNESPGYEFWIDNILLKDKLERKRSLYFYEILKKSKFIKNEGKYSRYEIK